MSVLAVKLVTGQEFFAECTRTQDGRLMAKGPVSLRLVPSKIQGGEPNMAFVPFLEMADHNEMQPLLIEPLHIVYTYTPAQDFVEEYNKIFFGENTGSKQIITG
jgi:hypothetical protein